MVNGINAGNNGYNSYGNIQRAGQLPNGRAVYRVIDANGQVAGKLSLPQEQVGEFENAYKDIMRTAPKIQKYVAENSSEADVKRRRNIGRGIVAVCGLAGAGIPLVILRKSTSVTKKILSTVGGVVAGIAAGFAASLQITTPPGSLKFMKAGRTLSKLDIQPIE